MRNGRDGVMGDKKKTRRKEMILSAKDKERQEGVRKRTDGVAIKGKKRNVRGREGHEEGKRWKR